MIEKAAIPFVVVGFVSNRGDRQITTKDGPRTITWADLVVPGMSTIRTETWDDAGPVPQIGQVAAAHLSRMSVYKEAIQFTVQKWADPKSAAAVVARGMASPMAAQPAGA